MAAPGAAPRGAFAAACLLVAAALGAAYANHFDNDFQFDDHHVIVGNPALADLGNVGRFFTDPLTFSARPHNATYRPLLTLSYALDRHRAGGVKPRAFHQTQFALLLLLGALLVLVYRGLLERAAQGAWTRWAALFGAALFCLHTANTETVNYLSARSDLLSTLAVVASFAVVIGWPAGRRLQLHLLVMLIGMLVKPAAAVFAPLLLVFSWFYEEDGSAWGFWRSPERARLGRAVLRALPALLVAAAFGAFVVSMDSDALVWSDVDTFRYAISQPFVWLHYFRLFLLPVGLTADTDWKFPTSPWNAQFAIGLLFLAGLLAAIVWLSRERSRRPAAFGLAWFALGLLPTSSFFPLSEVYNEHRIFLPFVGLGLVAAWLLDRALAVSRGGARAAAVALVAVALLAAHGVGTHRRNRVWATEETLWANVVRTSPQNGRGLMNYAVVKISQGRMPEALELLERARELLPNYPFVHLNLGVVRSELGDEALAEFHFRRAIEIEPAGPARSFYAPWLLERGRGPEALAQLERAVAANSADVVSQRLLLRVYAALGEADGVRRVATSLQRTTAGDPLAAAYLEGRIPFSVPEPTAATYAHFGRLKIEGREWLDAAVLYRGSLALDASSAGAWNNLGWAVLKLGFPERALADFEKAQSLDAGFELARSNAAWARRLARQSRPGR